MMTLTRRDLLSGAVVAGAAGGLVGAAAFSPEAPAGVVSGCQPPAAPILEQQVVPAPAEPTLAPIPSDVDLRRWEAVYKAHYKMRHATQNEAIANLFADGIDGPGLRLDKAAEKVELEMQVVESLVNESDDVAVAFARGEGFGARRDGLAATNNPYWDPTTGLPPHYDHYPYRDKFMAWYAGWVQAGDQSHVYGPRGYTPPQPYHCPTCNQAEGSMHLGTCDLGCFSFMPTSGDHPVRRPQRPGRNFT